MFDDTLFTGQPEQNQEAEDPTRAPDYTPIYETIFKTVRTNVPCAQCNTPPTPSLTPQRQTPQLNTSPANTTTTNGTNVILNQLLNNQPCRPTQQPQTSPAPQQMPHAINSTVTQSIGSVIRLPTYPGAQDNCGQQSQPTQPVQPSYPYHHHQQQRPQQQPVQHAPHLQHSLLYTHQRQMPTQQPHQHQQQPHQQQQPLHQQQQQHHQLRQQPTSQPQLNYIQHQQQQQNNYNQQQQQQLVHDYNRISPRTSPSMTYADDNNYFTNVPELSPHTYGLIPLNNQVYYQNPVPTRPITTRITYVPPQQLRGMGQTGAPQPPVVRALRQRLIRPNSNPIQPQQPTAVPQSVANLQRTIGQQVSSPVAHTQTPPPRHPSAPVRTYQRRAVTTPTQTTVPPAASPADGNSTSSATTFTTTQSTAIPVTPVAPVTNAAPTIVPTAISSQSSKDKQQTTNAAVSNSSAPAQTTPVSVSSTTRPPSAAPNQANDSALNHVETANKACQVKSIAVTMVHKCLSASVETEDQECQTDLEEKRPEPPIRTYVDRASSPIIFPNPLVRTKSTPKRKRPETKDESDDEEEEIQVC